MERKAKGDEKRSNIHVGGKGEPVELDVHTKKISIETAKVLGAEICGVDIGAHHIHNSTLVIILVLYSILLGVGFE